MDFDTEKTYNISLTVEENGCTSEEETNAIAVYLPLPTPIVNCGELTTSSVEFIWNDIAGANDYEITISINGGTVTTSTTSGATTYTESGLNVNDEVTITVVALGNPPCGNSEAGTAICTTQDCPSENLVIDLTDLDYCVNDGIIDLSATPNGGTFSGTGVINGNQFDPSQAGLGTNTIAYQYINPANSCEYNTNIGITVYEVPTATFDLPTELCADGTNTANVTYTGTASVNATYNWNFDGATVVSGTDAGPYQLDFDTEKTYNISLTVEENGCTSEEVTNAIAVYLPLPTPIVNCGELTTSSVEFIWNDIAGANDYEITISINGGTATTSTTSGATTYTESGLNVNDEVTITVVALGNPPCGNSEAGTAICTTQDCPDENLVIDLTDLDYCVSDGIIDLSATPNGGTFSGTGVINGNQFDPSQAGLGTNTIAYQYINPANSCEYNTNIGITVYEVPTATFDLPTELCADGTNTANVTYTGTASVNATYNWNFDGATVVSGTDAGPYQLDFDTEKTYNISLMVEENGCTSEEVTNAIAVYLPLSTPIVNCGELTTSSVEFIWNDIAGANDYEITISINGGTAITSTTSGATTYTESGLNVNDEVTITVVALGNPPCGNSEAGTAICTTQDCPSENLVIDLTDLDYCVSDGIIDLSATPNGGTFSGTGIVNGNQFDPSQAGLGTNTIAYQYINPANSCEYNTNIGITVYEVPTATFDIPTELCADGTNTANVTYTGTASVNATYNWNFDGATVVSGTDAGPYQLDFDTEKTYNISLTVEENGCTSEEETNAIAVYLPLSTPIVNCGELTTSSVEFIWNDIAGANDYEITISINGGTATTSTTSGATTYTESGLNVNDEVTITVVALGNPPCGNSEAGTAICTAQDCPSENLVIDLTDLDYCVSDGIIDLSATPNGGTFSGTGVINGNQFDPSQANLGTNTIAYQYINPANSCEYNTNIGITVYEVPTATFDLPTELCADGTNTATVAYTGTASVNATYNWNFDGATVVSGTGAGPYQLDFDTEKTYNIILTVEENGCTSEEVTNAIAVYLPLPTPIVNCGELTTSSVEFIWNDIAGANDYEITISINGGTAIISTTGGMTSHTESGLNVNDEVTITVVALGNPPCGNSEAGTAICTAKDCPPTDLIIDIDEVYCETEGIITLVATPSGGTFTINGNPATDFNPSDLGAGTHTIAYQYTNADDCVYDAETTVTIDGQPVADISLSDENICIGDAIDLSFIGTVFNNTDYEWLVDGQSNLTGEGPHNLTFNASGEYAITLNLVNGLCSDTYTTTVYVSETEVSTIEDTEIIVGESITLTTEATSALSPNTLVFDWDDTMNEISGSTEQSPLVSPIETTTYTVAVMDENGCMATDEVTISVRRINTVVIPNAFSPNGDGVNDVFIIDGFNIIQVDVQIYNRWGNPVYHSVISDSGSEGWNGEHDGRDAELGVYVYRASITFEDGEVRTLKGNVTLVR